MGPESILSFGGPSAAIGSWDEIFGGKEDDVAWVPVALPDGGLTVFGYTNSKGAGSGDAWVLRLDADGRLLWDKTFGGKEPDLAATLVALPDGGLTVLGYTNSKGAGFR